MTKPRNTISFDYRYGYREAMKYLSNELSEEEYISFHFDSSMRNSLAWNELIILQSQMDIFRTLLLKLKLTNRRRVLLNKEIIGFSQRDLYERYGIPRDMVRSFLGLVKKKDEGKKHSVEIRAIISKKSFYPDEFIQFIALITRVPINWLIEENPSDNWDIDYFNRLPVLKECEFFNYLSSKSININDIEGFTIQFENFEPIKARFEWIKGGFILEVMNKKLELNTLFKIKQILSPFNI
ncbi:hypothetical protein ACOI1C_22295, partial [Bacillus sp. DJP31]|uniref:hypothetical protein n=1 Tax=Bacillus sp. DJP31 TaxID=3409789 RepID=UPI003BB6C757